jgi:hypothetical protein
VIVDEDGAAPPRDDASPSLPAPLPTGGETVAPEAQDPSSPATGDGIEGDANGSGSGGSSSGSFSGTTVQVEDVDEADIVKADGDRIYLLHGGTLFALQGWPANATQILGSVQLEGQPAEMFVSGGKAVVFSRVYRDIAGDAARGGYDYYGATYTKVSVLDVSEGTPRLLRESFVEGEYTSSRRHGEVVRAVLQDGFKIPRLDAPAIEYRDAFGQTFPQEDIDAQVDAWLARTVRSIRATDLGDWLPREFTQQGAEAVAVPPRCADYYSPDPGLTENGVTSVVSLDLADVSAPLSGATILGRAERVYANDSALLITQTDYRHSHDGNGTQQTIIHRFDIGAGGTAYTASGAVAGSINSQFSLDERDGVIRVSTTEQRMGRIDGVISGGTAPGGTATPLPTEPKLMAPATDAAEPLDPAADVDSPAVPGPAVEPAPADQPLPVEPITEPLGPVNRVVTLGTDGDTLTVLGTTEDFGATESIFATRFIGDRGYVVTFRQTDPLFVIDLADPTHPHTVGELHIPGFSNYLFPLDENHLFAIGRDATEQGSVQGLALQIFDVSDPAHPTLATKYVYADTGDSPANVDHRAITFHPDRNVVAFPHQSYTTGESTLDVFELTNTRITQLGGVAMGGEIDTDACFTNYFGPLPEADMAELRAQVAANPDWQREVLASCRYGRSFRRGLFRDDFVYGISNTGIYVYDMTQMGAGAVGTLALPAEVYDAGSGYGGDGSNGGIATPTIEPAPPSVQPALPPVPDPATEVEAEPAPEPSPDGAGSGGSAGAAE